MKIGSGLERSNILQQQIRNEPPGLDANNNDVFVWALYLLGGASRNVDVEEIYLKAFEIAPLRFGWRTKPEIPNFKKTSKALQSVEAATHVGLLQKLGPNYRRLTPEGVSWIEAYIEIFKNTYSINRIVDAPANSELARQFKELQNTGSWKKHIEGKTFRIEELAQAFRCSPSSSDKIWQDRFADLHQLARLIQDEKLTSFLKKAEIVYSEKGKANG